MNPNAKDDKLMTEQEAAEFLNVQNRTLQSWRLRGGGPRFVKLSTMVRYRAVDLQEFVNSGLRRNTSEEVA